MMTPTVNKYPYITPSSHPWYRLQSRYNIQSQDIQMERQTTHRITRPRKERYQDPRQSVYYLLSIHSSSFPVTRSLFCATGTTLRPSADMGIRRRQKYMRKKSDRHTRYCPRPQAHNPKHHRFVLPVRLNCFSTKKRLYHVLELLNHLEKGTPSDPPRAVMM
jgi:hypothetical protein